MGKSFLSLFPIVLILILLTGCWDRVEIEDRGFTIGAAFDLADDTMESNEGQQSKHVVKGTYQLVFPGGLTQGTSQGGGQKAYQNLTSKSDSVFEQVRNLASETSRTAFFPHLKMIIVSEEVAKKPSAFENIVDLFIRDHEMRRGIKVLISEGNAGDILNVDPKPDNLPAIFLDSVVENATKNPKMLQEVHLGDVHEHLISKSSYAIPKIVIRGNKVDVEGAAIFQGHNNTMVDFVSGKVTEGLNFVKGDYRGGLIKTKVGNDMVVYEIKRAKSNVNVNAEDKSNIKFHISIETEGNIGESFSSMDYTNPQNITKVQEAIEKEIKNIAENAVQTFQNDIKVDALGLGGYLQRKDYELWGKIQNEWEHGENHFSESQVTITVKPIIRTSGSVIQSKK